MRKKSTAALAGPEGPIMARNLDWSPADLLAQAGCVLPLENGLHAGFPGGIGVVTGLSHNCFARTTHTYLEFDSGKDFDTQVVVLVIRSRR